MTAEREAGALPLDCWAKCKAGLHAWQNGDTFTRCTDPRWCRMAAEPNAARWLDRVTPEIERIAQEAQRHMDANDRDKLRANLAAAGSGLPDLTPDDHEWIAEEAARLFRESERRRGGVRPATAMPQDFLDYWVAVATWNRARTTEARHDR